MFNYCRHPELSHSRTTQIIIHLFNNHISGCVALSNVATVNAEMEMVCKEVTVA
jgi:hypothetical protein